MLYNILIKTGKFKSTLRKEDEKPVTEQTQGSMKMHFTMAHKAMKESTNPTASSAGFTEEHTNSFAQKAANQLQAEQDTSNNANLVLM